MSTVIEVVEEAAFITGVSALVGWLGRKTIKEPLTGDPSTSIMHFLTMTGVVAGSIGLKNYLVKEKYIPNI